MSAGGGELALDRGWVNSRPEPHAGECGSLGAIVERGPSCLGKWLRRSRFSVWAKNSSWSASAIGVWGGVRSRWVKRLGLLEVSILVADRLGAWGLGRPREGVEVGRVKLIVFGRKLCIVFH
jgi:hypothetical protein